MREMLRRIYYLLNRRRLERELEEEMATHRKMMPAGREAAFGSELRLREDARETWGWMWLDHIRQDLAYAARLLRRSPGFTIAASAVLALGVGVNLAELHIFNALINRISVRDADSLYRFSRHSSTRSSLGFPYPATIFYREHNTVLSAVLAETTAGSLELDGAVEALRCGFVSGNYFVELGIIPAYGRLLDENDAKPGAPPVAVLGFRYWERQFGRDPTVVGRTIRLNNKPVQVVGVLPYDFDGLLPRRTAVWLPIPVQPYLRLGSRILEDFDASDTVMYGRLKPGVSPAEAEAQFGSLTEELHKRHPRHFGSGERLRAEPAELRPMHSRSVAIVATWMLLTMLVLLSACANLGNMLLARGLAREREIQIRLAVGADRWRVIRQLMTENLMLAALGSAAGLVLGKFTAQLLLYIVDAPPDMRLVTDWRILFAGLVFTLISALAFGLAPALQTVRRGPKTTRARQMLVSVQIAVGCVLLIVTSLLTRALVRTLTIDLNFDYGRMIVVDPELYFRKATPAAARQAVTDLASRLRQVRGVEGVTVATIPPLGRRVWHVTVPGGEPRLSLNAVDDEYFSVMQLPVFRGRTFFRGEEDAIVMSQSAARALWPDEEPLGKALEIDQRKRTVIGVVKDSGANLLSDPDSVEAYTPLGERSAIQATLLVRTSGDPVPLLREIRPASAAPGLFPSVRLMRADYDMRVESMERIITIVGTLGGVAALVAAIGIFGLVAFTVSQRTREIGVRMALGAPGRHILRTVLGQYAIPVIAGTMAGIGIARALSQVLHNQVPGLRPHDAAGYIAGVALFTAVALAAGLLPARRALRINPSDALRSE